MALVKYQNWAVDEAGNIVASSAYEVRDTAGVLVSIYSDAGGTAASNPGAASTGGLIEFYAEKGVYDITVGGGLSATTQRAVIGGPDVAYFASRAEAVAASDAELDGRGLMHDGNVWYQYSSGATVFADLPDWTFLDDITPMHFGAAGDGTTDDTAAVQAAVDWVKDNNGIIKLKQKHYLITDTIDLFEDRTSEFQREWGFEGDGIKVSSFVNGITDRSKAMFDAKGDGSRTWVRKSLKRFSVDSVDAGGTAVPFRLGATGTTFIEDVFGDSVPNTFIESDGMYNDRWKNITTYRAGVTLLYDDFSSATVTGTAASNTLTVSGYTATSALIGKLISVDGGTYPGQYTVTAVPSATELTVTPALEGAYSAAGFTFVPQVDCTSGSPTVTADCDCFDSSMIGAKLCIRLTGSSEVFYSEITAVPASNQVTFADNLPVTESGAYIASPVIALTGSINEQNDIILENLHIEDYSGVAMYLNDVTKGRIHDFKTHGYSFTLDTQLSIGSIWMAKCEMTIDGLLESDARGPERIFVADQGARFARFSDLQCALKANAAIFTLNTFTGNGCVTAGTIAITGNSPLYWTLADDPNTVPRFEILGVVEASGEGSAVIGYIPESVRLGAASERAMIFHGSYTMTITDASGNTSPTSATVNYTRIGKLVTVFFDRLQNIDTTGLTGTDTIRIGLPLQVGVAGSGSAHISNTASGTAPFYLRATPNETYATIRSSDAGSNTLPVNGLTSGTSDLWYCTLQYTTIAG